ncbi:unnamed protein product [marine sediment metagenome]|uniref:Uncharacterized protein n=1 Tax=marine sediment metagenome TaxID=412755 RepID=X1T897_9ZZZZ
MSPYIMRGVHKLMSSRQIIGAIRGAGYGYRSADMYRDIRIARIEFDKTDALHRLPTPAMISEEYYTPVEYTKVTTRYATVAKVRYRDAETGQEWTDYLTAGHDAPRKVGEVVEGLWTKIEADRYYRELERIEAVIENTYRGLGWT